jgi:hypothetical protein
VLQQLNLGQRSQQTQNNLSLLQRLTRQLTDEKWVAKDLLFK